MKVNFFLGLLVTPILLFAQTEDKGSQKTVEDVYLQSSVEVQVVRSLVAEEGRAEKVRALDYIEKMVENKKVTEKSVDVLNLLNELGTEGTLKQIRQDGRITNDYPEVRRKAAELLGQVPSEKSREILIEIAEKDPEPMVAAEAIYSLGLIGSGDSAIRVESLISEKVRHQNAINPDSNFAYAAVSAIEMLADKSKGKVNQNILSSLIKISEGNYIRPVREKAKQVLDKLTKY